MRGFARARRELARIDTGPGVERWVLDEDYQDSRSSLAHRVGLQP